MKCLDSTKEPHANDKKTRKKKKKNGDLVRKKATMKRKKRHLVQEDSNLLEVSQSSHCLHQVYIHPRHWLLPRYYHYYY